MKTRLHKAIVLNARSLDHPPLAFYENMVNSESQSRPELGDQLQQF